MKKTKLFARFILIAVVVLSILNTNILTSYASTSYNPFVKFGYYTGRDGTSYPCSKHECGRAVAITDGETEETAALKHKHTTVRTDLVTCGGFVYELKLCHFEGHEDIYIYDFYPDEGGEHVWTEKRVPATDVSEAYIEWECSRCGETKREYQPSSSDTDAGNGEQGDANKSDGTTDSKNEEADDQGNPTDPSSVSKISISQAKVTLKKSLFMYDGAYKKPQVASVVLNKKTLNKGTDYTVTYANNKKAGTASVIITGCGAYCDTCKKDFRIVKKGEKITPSGSKHVYTITGNNTVAFKGTSATGIIKIPSKIKAYGVTFKVTSIAAGALKGKSEVTGLTIPASVTSVGKNAFDGTAISNVKIYGNLTTIGAKAFYNKGGKCTYTVYASSKKKYNAIVKKLEASSNKKSNLKFKYKKK